MHAHTLEKFGQGALEEQLDVKIVKAFVPAPQRQIYNASWHKEHTRP